MLTLHCFDMPGSGLAALSLEVRLGWRHEPAPWRGLVHLLEHARLLGSARYPDPQEATRPWGVTIDGRTNAESSELTAVCLPDDVPRVVPVLADLLFHPAFDTSRLGIERDVVAASLARREDFSPWSWARLKLDDILFASDELASLGTADTVGAWTRDALHSWHRRFDHAGNVRLLAAGDVDAAVLEEALCGVGEPTADGERPSLVRTPPASRCHHETVADVSGELYLGFAFDPDAFSPAVDLLRVLVGNYPASRLWRRFRTDSALAYTVDASLRRQSDACRLALYVGLSRPDAAPRVWEGLLDLLETLRRRPPGEEELTWARRTARVELRRRGASPEGALQLLREHHVGDRRVPDLDLGEAERALERPSPEDVRRAAVEILRRDRAALSVVGDVGTWRPAAALDRMSGG